ncbi:MAG: hypothetical protein FJ098_11695 [Deltaproteobacteria bacterium]|nr:hypothetical protein [Deltaproteobacteria bacterium]
MDVLFRRYFWVVHVVLIVAVAFLAARLTASYVEYGVLFVPWSEDGGGLEGGGEGEFSFRNPTEGRRVNRSLRDEIVKRSAKPVEEIPAPETPEEAPAETPEEVPEEQPAASGLSIDFLAAIATEDPLKNMAFVKIDGGDGRWVTVGTELLNGVVASEITRTMFRASDGTVKYLWEKAEPEKEKGDERLASLAGGGLSGRPERTVRPERPGAQDSEPPPSGLPGQGMEGVTQTGPNEYQISRGLLDEKLQDLGALSREARVIPNYDRESGTYKGFKLIGVRPNSLYRNIGIRSGDVILQVNGEEMNSPSKALELFTKLQTSNEISLDVKRRGKVETLIYKIQ